MSDETKQEEDQLHKGVDVNDDGILDDDELTEEQLKAKKSHKDIKRLFFFVYAFTSIMLCTKFIAYKFFGVVINIDLSKLANSLNAIIVIVGSVEGIRGFQKTSHIEAGERVPVPSYKLKEIFTYLVAFAAMAVVSCIFTLLTNIGVDKAVVTDIPEFSINDFTSGLLSNTVAYLIARFGDKIAEEIDLSNLNVGNILKKK